MIPGELVYYHSFIYWILSCISLGYDFHIPLLPVVYYYMNDSDRNLRLDLLFRFGYFSKYQ